MACSCQTLVERGVFFETGAYSKSHCGDGRQSGVKGN